MSESLNVIALISGGKDSFFSLLHCIRNGHKVIALGNLHPPIPEHKPPDTSSADDENDLNSFMYQTVGHTVIPLYEQALGIPLYRQAITGSAVQTGTSYSHASITGSQYEDETESLVPLLKRIIEAHPEANALSTGAILSTYQRTRIESVALRLGLTPLSFLWQYPTLPPGTQISLLQDMQAAGLEARIIKVASGGLDEGFLWENVASVKGMARVERAMKRFGMVGDGAVLGEGGEFETLVVDGPGMLFKKRIVIEESDRRIVREGGGAAWLQIREARLVDKEEAEGGIVECRIPGLLDQRSEMILSTLREDSMLNNTSAEGEMESRSPAAWTLKSSDAGALQQEGSVIHWTIMANKQSQGLSISEEAKNVVENIRSSLSKSSLSTTDIVSTVIILRNMSDFTTINQIYGSLFPHPNPPSRVTISSGSSMPTNINLLIHLTLHNCSPSSSPSTRKSLHVQSRSYWAPANIGPYSQASTLPPSSITIAGQIPLIPHTMQLPSPSSFPLSTALSLQHLLRIADAMNIGWFSSACVYIPSSSSSSPSPSTQSRLAYQAWKTLHTPPTSSSDKSDSDEEEQRDIWAEKYQFGHAVDIEEELKTYPDFSLLLGTGGEKEGGVSVPPFWVAEVEELPRGSEVEWHAGVGVCRGGVEISTTYQPNTGTTITITSTTSQSTTTYHRTHFIPYHPSSTTPSSLALPSDPTLPLPLHLLYIDTSLPSLQEIVDRVGGRGIIPCKSLWDGEGRRLGVVGVWWGGK
ncbi:hypothetical protein CJF30_00005452 [Rutstroemia sp. NJR-2017a BBW]|nr:hypothetical protein CJF30_00005932 [Rutstroemia sp. NJR-2017a BBW]PQE08580.1 hypothetical protein CJF30_00005452 [Rutstroemia sp. NJR-2017a BBW]